MRRISQPDPIFGAIGVTRHARQWRTATGFAAAGVLLVAPAHVYAQSEPSDELRDLIPDSAVENPDAWALELDVPPEPQPQPVPDPNAPIDGTAAGNTAPKQTASDATSPAVNGSAPIGSDGISSSTSTAAATADLEGPDDEVILPETPMLPMPGITVPWPDDLELPEVQPLDPDPAVVELEKNAPPLTSFEDGDITNLENGVIINLPGNRTDFPVRDEFLERFQSLSSINALQEDQPNIAQLTARANEDEALLNSLLRVYGYYDGLVIRSISGVNPGELDPTKNAVVRFDIRPGTRYTFNEIDLGQLSSAPDDVFLRQAFAIKPGDPVDSDDIVEQENSLQTALEESGYPFYDMGEAELLIDHDTEKGDLSLPVDPGPKTAFGPVVSLQPKFLSSEHLQRMARFKPGEIYQQSKVLDLRQAILATGLVSTVQITPRRMSPVEATVDLVDGTKAKDIASGDFDGPISSITLPRAVLDVDLTPAPLRTISGQAGYGSREGFRIQGYWENRNLFPPEGLLRVRGTLGTQEQLAGVTYRKNNFYGRDKVLTFDLYGRASSTDAYEAQTISLSGEFQRQSTVLFQKRWSWSIGFQLQGTRERERNSVNSIRQDYLIASLPGRVLYDTSDSLLNPTKGFRLGLRVTPELSREGGKTLQYTNVEGEGSVYRRINDNVILAGRMALGTIFGADIQQIAPSRRFYAGGGSSVRGYGYQNIGPRDTEGQPVGGRSLAEFNLEARVKTKYLDGALSFVPFLDAGTVSAGATPDLGELKFGAGIGVRYETGFGPIRVDLGVPINPGPFDRSFQIYVSLGQAF